MSRGTKVVGLVAAVFLLVGLLWHPLIEPRLVKFPLNVDRAENYAGTVVVYLDPSTGAALSPPQTVPLTINRKVVAIPRASGARVALVDESDTVQAGPVATVQENIYAIDRHNGKNVKDRQAVTLVAGNAVDRSGSYSLVVGRNTPSHGASYKIWKTETAGTYTLHNATPPTGSIFGVHVVNLTGSLPPTPVAPYEQTQLLAQGFPASLSTTQLAAQLQSAGVNIYETLAQLSSILTPAEMNTVTVAVAKGVPLQYYSSSQGNLSVEPRTGIFVKISGAVRGFFAKPDVKALAPVVGALTPHAAEPTVSSLLSTLGALNSAPPQQVYELRYDQTPDSVARDASYARSQADKVRVVTVTIRRALLAIGLLLLVVFAVLAGRGGLGRARRREGIGQSPPAAGHRAA